MTQSLNLMPEQEVQAQTKTKLLKLSTVFTIVLLIIVCGVSAYFMVTTTKLKNQIEAEEGVIAGLRSQINNKSAVEINARNLGKKFATLKSILNDRLYYSYLLTDIESRKPTEISVNQFSILNDNKISISGKSPAYPVITTYVNHLLGNNYEPANPTLKGVYKSATLNQVDMTNQGSVSFTMSVEFDPEKLKYAK